MLLRSLVLTGALALSLPVLALEYPIGAPQNVAGMEVAAVYLQPVEMEPDGHMRKASESDSLQYIARPAANPDGKGIALVGVRARVGF